MTNFANADFSPDEKKVSCVGMWNHAGIKALTLRLPDVPPNETVQIDGSAIVKMDIAGVWLLDKWVKKLSDQGNTVSFVGFTEQYTKLLHLIDNEARKITEFSRVKIKQPNIFYKIGYEAFVKYYQLKIFLSFVGEVSIALYQACLKPSSIHWNSIAGSVEEMGYDALPIIGLLSFLIGVVLTYQMGNELEAYGANIYIVNVAGLAMLREFGPLISAIIVTGRTGSALTAQIGTMKVKEEIDALKAMGLSPINRLVVPRIIAILLVFPLLCVWSIIFGLLGSMAMSQALLDVTFYDFINRFPQVITSTDYWVGMSKAPIFALLIVAVGCFQGFQVQMSAESIGKLTTRSVVQGIFLIIIADGAISVIYSALGI